MKEEKELTDVELDDWLVEEASKSRSTAVCTTCSVPEARDLCRRILLKLKERKILIPRKSLADKLLDTIPHLNVRPDTILRHLRNCEAELAKEVWGR